MSDRNPKDILTERRENPEPVHSAEGYVVIRYKTATAPTADPVLRSMRNTRIVTLRVGRG
jgi:hypothetical protein